MCLGKEKSRTENAIIIQVTASKAMPSDAKRCDSTRAAAALMELNIEYVAPRGGATAVLLMNA